MPPKLFSAKKKRPGDAKAASNNDEYLRIIQQDHQEEFEALTRTMQLLQADYKLYYIQPAVSTSSSHLREQAPPFEFNLVVSLLYCILF